MSENTRSKQTCINSKCKKNPGVGKFCTHCGVIQVSCKHFQTGNCRNGKKCPYAHVQEEKKKPRKEPKPSAPKRQGDFNRRGSHDASDMHGQTGYFNQSFDNMRPFHPSDAIRGIAPYGSDAMRPHPNYYSGQGCFGPLPPQHFSPYPGYDGRNPGYWERPYYQEDPRHFRKPGSNVHGDEKVETAEKVETRKKKKNVKHNPKHQHSGRKKASSDEEDSDVSSSDDDTAIRGKAKKALRQGEHQKALPFDIRHGALRQGERSDKPSLECREVECTLYQKSISGAVPGQKCKGKISGKNCKSVLKEQSLIEQGLRWFKNLDR